MAGMPAMSEKKPALDVAVIMGGKPKGGGDASSKKSEDDGESEGDELPAGFEEACNEAFPDMEGDMERMKACARMCRAVMSEEMAE